MGVCVGRGRISLLLASSSVAALVLGVSAPRALAACTVVTGSTASFTNPGGATINCLQVTTATVTGSVVNAGKITAANAVTTPTAVLITNSTIGGGLTNTGTISGLSGINYKSGSLAGGITNSGTISSHTAIQVGDGVNAFTLSGGISNGGILTGAGFGIVASGPGTFAGGIANSSTIAEAILGIQAGGFTSFSGGISNGGLITNVSGIGVHVASIGGTFTGGVVNSGTIASFSTGVLVNGDHAILGGITNSGTITNRGNGIVVDSVVQFGSSSLGGGITNTGAITVGHQSQAGIVVRLVQSFVGAISNAGTISSGTAGIEIGPSVTFATGSAIVNSGTIIGTTAAVDVTQASTAIIINQTAGLISGDIKLSSHADVLNITGGTVSGNIVGQGSTNTVNFAPGSGNTFVYGPGFGVSGVNQVNINSGTVVLNGTNSATNVDVVGGTLAGIGTLDPLAVTIHSGATFAPGNGTPGTSMTITGNLSFQPGATYQVQLNPTTASFATVSGTAALAGNVLASFAPGSYVTRQYTILQSGGLSGTFAGLTTQSAPAGFTASLSYDAADVFLNLSLSLAAPGNGFNVNQGNVANAIAGFFNGGGALPPGFVNILGLSGGNLANALTRLDGEAATDAQKGAFNLMTGFLNLMLDPFAGGRTTLAGGGAIGFAAEPQAGLPPDLALAYASVLKAPPATFDQRWSIWGAAFGGYNTTKGNATVGSNDVAASDFGFAAGADYRVSPDTTVGVALAGGGTGWNLAQGLGGGHSDAFEAGVYATTRRGPAYLAGALGFANHWLTTDRFAPADHLQANFNGQSYGARLEGGWRLALPAGNPVVGVTPYVAAQTQLFRTPAYSEQDLTGAGFGLAYAAMSATDTRGELGARFDALQVIDHMPLILHARLAWAHDWVSNPALGAVFQALPGASFTVNGAAVPKNSALASAGAELAIARGWSLDAKFDGEFASGAQTYAGTGTLRHSW